MRKTLLFISLAIGLPACGEDEDPKGVKTIADIPTITVPFGTAFSEIDFPSDVTVTFDDNTAQNVALTFNEGSYDPNEAGDYEVEVILTLPAGTANPKNLTAAVTVTVATLKLRTVSEDGVQRYAYFYDDEERLDYFIVSNGTTYTYIYDANDRVTERQRELAGNMYPEKYFYHGDGKLDRIEFYSSANVLSQTHTYTYSGEKITKYDNSDQTVAGLKFRSFEYSNNDVSTVSFDIGNPWNFTYFTDKKIFAPLALDLADPQNQQTHPVATFTYVELSSYTSAYEYNAQGYPTKETRTFPGDGNKQVVITNTYQ